ncbi:LysM peptidoglycan-binding domain-containing protein [Nisaea nitritireducens]|uniref:LysM peptidoglycan-binding domain-containing protein n=1 Tax=Nisaea nitritireducens TaxID=568392 RepID=UPI0018690AFB|nr:LysM peptidoglycan-binding domain-containing protein [Nisaea nitritireducens]
MLSKPYLIGAAGILVLASAVGLVYWTTDEGGLPLPVETPAVTNSAVAPAPKTAAKAPDTTSPPAVAETPAPVAEKPDLAEPSFDVVRVDPEGNTVIAGKAKPNANVRIMDGERKIGEVQADDKGDWVFLPEQKLPSGSSVLTLESDTGTDTEAPSKSDNAVVVVIPEKGKDIAGRETKATEKPLAMVVPRDQASSAPTKILQAPQPKPEPAGAATETPKVQSFPETETAKADGTASPDAETDVTLDVIDYDDTGAVVFSGKTAPDTEVQIYVDNKLAARATSDADGNWSAKPEQNIETGTHQVRVDKVTTSGQVVARIELPFIRAVPITGLPKDSVVIIQPGNNLWRIASRVYGSGFRYTEIYQANSDQIRDPDLIYPGQVFGLPTVN